MMAATSAIPVLNRTEQQRHYGVDCGDAIHFEAGMWLPGGEHVKKIIVKNISTRSIKFKYELPTTKYFSMDFPTLTTLSPGMQTTLDVAFRPVKLEEYDDSVTFHVQIIEGGVTASSGRFRLPVIARIAKLAIEIPHGLDFGFCPTSETTTKTFLLRNTGQIDAYFDWSIPGAGDHGRPFAVHPPSGRVDVGQAVQLTVLFSPTCASVYVSTTVCTVRPVNSDAFASAPSQVEETMKISGISKFTHIAASETELNFGEILVGAPNTPRAPTEKEFVLRNRSLVRASFQIVRVEQDCAPVFVFAPTSGVVEPESSLTIRVKYTPVSAGTFTCDHFEIVTPGGNKERITCKGRAVGPVISLWKKNLEANFVRARSINFQDVPVGRASTRVLTLRNESPIDAIFHFDCQQRGVFEFDTVSGRIAPLLDVNVTITFAPTRPGNFYRRFFVLLQNQTTLFVDVLGTGYDDKVRPSPFQQAHVHAYRRRVAAGLGLLSPDQLETYWQENGDDLFLQGALRASRDETSTPPQQLLTRSGETSLTDVEICHEFFTPPDASTNPIVVQGALVDFGNCSVVQFPSKKVLHVTNNTHGKVTCTWRVASARAGDDDAFQVFPDSLDISAGATAEFRIAFQPTHENTYYFAELEGFVSFKSNRTFRLVNVETFTPPWCVVARVAGNTFASPTEQFLPKVSFRVPSTKRRVVVFPPCFQGDHVFQTILLENASDTPALFSFVDDPTETFTCKPNAGYVAPKESHLVQIRFAPRKLKTYTHTLQCIVNNARTLPETLELVGIGTLPQLTLHDRDDDRGLTTDARLYIKPTAVGLESSRTLEITNISRVPLVFKWDVPRKYQDVLDVTPSLGRLNGRESVQVTCRFTPTDVREYVSRLAIVAKPISLAFHQRHSQTRIAVLQEASLRVQTRGTLGAVVFEPTSLQFETILVHTSAKRTLLIVNTADCDLRFALSQSVSGTIVTSTSSRAPADASAATLAFSERHGTIPARSRKQISITFLPRVAGAFVFDVRCETSSMDQHSSSRMDRRVHVQSCEVRAEASFPTVVIEDIRVPDVPTPLAWHQFLCHEINEYLAAPLSPEEAQSDQRSTPRGGSDHDGDGGNSGPSIKHVAIPFTPAPLGATTQQVFLKLTNPGSLVVEFALKYPREGNVEIEHWAETGAPSSEEVRLNAIIDSQVFGITPRRATLLPHQSVTLSLSYAYTSDAYGGMHDLPLLLQVDKGKRLMLELQGRTLARGEPRLFLPQRVFHLSPVMIGEFRRGFVGPRRHDRHGVDEMDKENQPVAHTSRPPVQQIRVFNVGDTAFRLEVSTNAFAKLRADNYDVPVLHCATTSDIVPAQSSLLLDIEFSLIEARTIEANLILKAHGLMGKTYKEAAMVTLIATGYHPLETTLADLRREHALSAAPRRQLIAVPGQSVRLVCDHVDFGHKPMYTQVTELVVLENRGGSPIRFEWDRTHMLVTQGVLQFVPASGELARGAEALIRVTLTSRGDPFVVQHDIACMITPMIVTDEPAKFAVTRSAVGTTEPDRMRLSVVARSTATQEAVAKSDKSIARPTPSGSASPAPSRKAIALSANGVVVQPTRSETYPLYVRVFAHILPTSLYERFYPRELVHKLPPSTVMPLSEASVTPSKSTLLPDARAVITDVMEALVADVLNSDAVQGAMDHALCPLPADMRAAAAAEGNLASRSLAMFARARQSDDCQAIVTNVMENTVFNILQELFHDDIDKELRCVPRRAVFHASVAR